MTKRFRRFSFPFWVTVLAGLGVLVWAYARTWPFPPWLNYTRTEPIEIRGRWKPGKGLANVDIVYLADGQRVPDPVVRFDVRRQVSRFVAGPTEAGGAVRVCGAYRYTPCPQGEKLFGAIACQHYQWVWLVPEFGLIEAPWDAETAPVIAALGNLEKLRLLLKKGADVNAKDDYGRTALFYVRTPEEARELVAAGANVETRDTQGCPPLISAAWVRELAEMRALLAVGANPNAKDRDGDTALIAAARPLPFVGGPPGTDAAKLLLAAHANPNAQAKDGMTALMWAAADGCVPTVEVLLAARADVNLRNKKGQTALAIARRERQTEVVRLLRRAGAKE